MNFYDILLAKKLGGGSGGGGTEVEDAFVTNTLSGAYTNDRVSYVGDYAMQRKNITEAYFPNVTDIGTCAFYACSELKTISFPKATTIGSFAFGNCTSLETVNLSEIQGFANYPSTIFSYVSTIKTFIAPKLNAWVSQGYSRFLPTLEYWDTGTGFYVTLSAPNLHTFILRRNASTWNKMAGTSFPNLACVKLYDVSHMGRNEQFSGCSKLMELYLYNSSVVSGMMNMLTDTPFTDSSYTGSFGSIYVPTSLVSDYKIASIWSNFADRITAYEG